MMSSTSRVFNGCRALFATAKSGTGTPSKSKPSAASAKKTSSKSSSSSKTRSSSTSASKKTKQDRPPLARPTGILKLVPISPALHSFLGSPESSRSDAVKKVWDYIKLQNLQNPTDKREVYCDDKLKTIFEGKDKVGFLEIGKLISRHFVKTAD